MNLNRLKVDKAKLAYGLDRLACGLDPGPEFIQEYYILCHKRLESYWIGTMGVEYDAAEAALSELLAPHQFESFGRNWIPHLKKSAFAYLTTTVDTTMKEVFAKRERETRTIFLCKELLQDINMMSGNEEFIKRGKNHD